MSKLALVVVLLSGCSFTARAVKRCPTTHALWVADTVGVVAGVAALSLAVAWQGKPESGYAGAFGSLGGLMYLGSADSGYRWRAQCVSRGSASVTASR